MASSHTSRHCCEQGRWGHCGAPHRAEAGLLRKGGGCIGWTWRLTAVLSRLWAASLLKYLWIISFGVFPTAQDISFCCFFLLMVHLRSSGLTLLWRHAAGWAPLCQAIAMASALKAITQALPPQLEEGWAGWQGVSFHLSFLVCHTYSLKERTLSPCLRREMSPNTTWGWLCPAVAVV